MGVGYSEQDRLRGSVEVTRRNIFGIGRTASVFARGSFRGSRFLLTCASPGSSAASSTPTPPPSGRRRTGPPSTTTARERSCRRAGRSPRTSLIRRYIYQDTDVFNIEVPIEESTAVPHVRGLGPLRLGVFDTRDDPLEPRRGVFLGADVQLSLEALGGESYLRSFLQATSVRRLAPDLVFALSARLGLAGTFGGGAAAAAAARALLRGRRLRPARLPGRRRRPAGRGDRRELYPTGGNALVLGGAELRYNLTRAFQLASFLDTATSTPRRATSTSAPALERGPRPALPHPVRPDPARLGLHAGPAAGDEGRSRFHLSIGHAF